MRKLLSALVVALVLGFVTPALADVPNISYTTTVTTTGALPWILTNGQGTCSILTSGSGTGLSITAQATSDTAANISAGTAAAVTATNLGTAGIITANGTSTGNVAATAINAFRPNVTAITGGTETITYGCSGASGASGSGGGGGGGGSVTQGTIPWVVSGTTGIDQTTPGVTNGVVVNGTLPAYATTPTFNCGTGCTVPLPIAPHLLTSASTLTCTSINTGSQQLGVLVNANAAAQTVSLVLYDEGASPTCVLADARATITFGQGQFIQTGFIGLSFMNGMAYTLSAAPQAGAPIVIQSTK